MYLPRVRVTFQIQITVQSVGFSSDYMYVKLELLSLAIKLTLGLSVHSLASAGNWLVTYLVGGAFVSNIRLP